MLDRPAHVDTGALKRAHPIAEAIEAYGIALRLAGRSLVGRCPFHPDRGRPNLYVYPATQSWRCYRCATGGDVITFVERMEGLDFRSAAARLGGVRIESADSRQPRALYRSQALLANARRASLTRTGWSPPEQACLAAAVELYHNRLLTDPEALAYVQGRGLDGAVLERCRVGYAAGGELAGYLRWRHLSLGAAVRTGLLHPDGREFLTGRIVVPELRAGRPVWLIGRAVEEDGSHPRYLALPGPKPLLGWEAVCGSRTVMVTEGVFDWLTLRSWGFPALALLGVQAPPATLEALARFDRIYLALDNDPAGRQATTLLQQALGERAIEVTLLPHVKDVAELAVWPDGRAVFTHLLGELDAAGTEGYALVA